GPLHEAADILVGAGGGDRLESCPGGREPGALNGVGIEVRPIEIAELAYVAAGGRILGQRLQDPAQLLQRALLKLIEGAPARAVGRDVTRVEPVTVGIAIEVIPRLHAQIAGTELDAPLPDLCVRRRGARRRRAQRR